ncbi:NUC189-domain-containing protein [Aaosphaeria arxii CBS 175.79]|uniref:NUC189-domain-containing protein n=1 Tax=Aaosphaeria arxii CBS 175.79 TaxID=1450172 RepID=A0A6A5XV97_9PLEO|nr:NUC189-domain-containing protein [Aaosphaeria arxii CBS 175.79]KAF2016856.1 NUC189-domain-containing protein [Aaosphaeria arxii CBS 175.79]
MPAAVASRARSDPMPPAKKTKLSQSRPNGLSSLINGKSSKKGPLAAKSAASNKSRSERVEEATTVVGGGRSGHGDVDMQDAPKVIEISSAEEESEYESGEDEEEEDTSAAQKKGAAVKALANGTAEDGEDDAMDADEELTFGEKLQAQEPESTRAPQIVDVEGAFDGLDASQALATARNRPLTTPNASSLGTVLTQALRTNDQDLLDSCLKTIDIDTIYATVERLPSPLVGNLLQKLAERLHKKPGRAGSLMVWVQWSLAAHGGYLASQPQLVKQLATLNKVLKERASGLQPLLSLKGRLDMLQAQLELRRRNQRRAAFDDEEEAVIYVEGEDDISSADEDEDSDADSETGVAGLRKRARQASDDEEGSSDDEMPTTMEVNEDSDEGSEDSDNMFDDEASETDNDTGDDMSEPMSDDFDEVGNGSESEEEARPTKRSEVGRSGLARRY